VGLAAELPTATTCSYNGFTFNNSTETLGIDSRMVLDQAKRPVSHVVHTITLRTYVFADGQGPDATTDDQMTDIRRRLSTQGAALVFESQGWGGFSINTGDAVKDVAWGPIPEVLSWKPVGANKAGEITWRVSVAIPECSQAKYAFALMELNFGLTFGIDPSGYTTRTYAGYLRIPQTRTPGTRKFSDSADAYFERINPDVPSGFRRTARNRTLSDDKCTLRFTITDVELPPNILPLGVVEVAGEHEHHNTKPANFNEWAGTLTATYELARGVPRTEALKCFLALAKDRLLDARQNPTDVVIPMYFSMREPEIYGKKAAAFTLAYSFTSRTAIILARGLWKPVPGTESGAADWTLWNQSLTINNGPLSLRGNAQMRFDPSSDAIVDLCTGSTARLTTQGNAPKPMQQALLETVVTDPPDPDNSFIFYENRLYVEEDTNRVLLKPLPTVQLQTVPVDGTQSGGFTQVPYLNEPDLQFQQRNAPIIYLRMIGRALRAAYEVPAPTLEKVADTPVIPCNVEGLNYFTCWPVGNIGFPLYAAKWDLRYALKRIPNAAMRTAANPIMQTTPDATRTPPISTMTAGGNPNLST
jgi:hypothetical protein